LLFNARSICNKLDYISCQLDDPQFRSSIVLVTESWLNASIPNCFIDFNGRFQVFRKDRDNLGGGVLALVDTTISACNVSLSDIFSALELVCFDVFMPLLTVRFILCYRPPKYDTGATNYLSLMLRCIEQLTASKLPTILVGDFNLPHVDWVNMTASSDQFHQQFLDCIVHNGFLQYVVEPSRGNNILDLVLCNDAFLISDCIVCPPIIGCDHNSINFTLHCSAPNEPEPPTVVIRDFRNADFASLNVFFNNIDWNNILTSTDDIDVMWNDFMSVVMCGIESFVPERIIKSCNSKHAKQYPFYIRKLLSKKCSAWRLYKKFHTDGTKAQYVRCDKLCKVAIDRFITKKENNLVSGGRVGDFYKYVNNKIVNNTGVGMLKNNNGESVVNAADKAELLNEFFSSVFTHDNHIIPPVLVVSNSSDSLEEVDFSFIKIFRVLKDLKAKHTVGPDGLSTFFLKNISGSIAFPLLLIFNQSFQSGKLPAIWKHAVITPVFKKGLASNVNNYRPISITCVCCKIMETVIKNEMLSFLLKHNKITKQQHGFLSKRSTVTQLLECVNDWSLALNYKQSVDCVYIDFAKAFDSVVHSKLCAKLTAFGIKGKLLSWIVSFLSCRTQQVKVGGELSSIVNVISGVPQGSVLGPLLFLIYINDLVEVFDSKLNVKLFADDVKIYIILDNIDSITLMQDGLNKLSIWADLWQLSISIPKCSVLHMGSSLTAHNYNINNNILPNTNSMLDLGVTIDCNLRFKLHINNIVAKAHQRACLILRCFKSRNAAVLFRAFAVYVRPLLEYCAPVWSPSYKSDILHIESVQRRFTKRLHSMWPVSYFDRLIFLKVDSLQLRRLKADLIMIYKIVNNLVDIDKSIISPSTFTFNLRRHSKYLVKPKINRNCRYFSFSCRNIDAWNSLPEHIVTSNNLISFKVKLNNIDLSKYCVSLN